MPEFAGEARPKWPGVTLCRDGVYAWHNAAVKPKSQQTESNCVSLTDHPPFPGLCASERFTADSLAPAAAAEVPLAPALAGLAPGLLLLPPTRTPPAAAGDAGVPAALPVLLLPVVRPSPALCALLLRLPLLPPARPLTGDMRCHMSSSCCSCCCRASWGLLPPEEPPAAPAAAAVAVAPLRLRLRGPAAVGPLLRAPAAAVVGRALAGEAVPSSCCFCL